MQRLQHSAGHGENGAMRVKRASIVAMRYEQMAQAEPPIPIPVRNPSRLLRSRSAHTLAATNRSVATTPTASTPLPLPTSPSSMTSSLSMPPSPTTPTTPTTPVSPTSVAAVVMGNRPTTPAAKYAPPPLVILRPPMLALPLSPPPLDQHPALRKNHPIRTIAEEEEEKKAMAHKEGHKHDSLVASPVDETDKVGDCHSIQSDRTALPVQTKPLPTTPTTPTVATTTPGLPAASSSPSLSPSLPTTTTTTTTTVSPPLPSSPLAKKLPSTPAPPTAAAAAAAAAMEEEEQRRLEHEELVLLKIKQLQQFQMLEAQQGKPWKEGDANLSRKERQRREKKERAVRERMQYKIEQQRRQEEPARLATDEEPEEEKDKEKTRVSTTTLPAALTASTASPVREKKGWRFSMAFGFRDSVDGRRRGSTSMKRAEKASGASGAAPLTTAKAGDDEDSTSRTGRARPSSPATPKSRAPSWMLSSRRSISRRRTLSPSPPPPLPRQAADTCRRPASPAAAPPAAASSLGSSLSSKPDQTSSPSNPSSPTPPTTATNAPACSLSGPTAGFSASLLSPHTGFPSHFLRNAHSSSASSPSLSKKRSALWKQRSGDPALAGSSHHASSTTTLSPSASEAPVLPHPLGGESSSSSSSRSPLPSHTHTHTHTDAPRRPQSRSHASISNTLQGSSHSSSPPRSHTTTSIANTSIASIATNTTDDNGNFALLSTPIPSDSFLDDDLLSSLAFSSRGSIMLLGGRSDLAQRPGPTPAVTW